MPSRDNITCAPVAISQVERRMHMLTMCGTITTVKTNDLVGRPLFSTCCLLGQHWCCSDTTACRHRDSYYPLYGEEQRYARYLGQSGLKYRPNMSLGGGINMHDHDLRHCVMIILRIHSG